MLTYLRYLGRLPRPKEFASLPRPVVEHVAAQLDITNGVHVLLTYGEQDGLARRHAQEIRSIFHRKPYSKGEGALKRQLASRAKHTEEGVKASSGQTNSHSSSVGIAPSSLRRVSSIVPSR
ncbi:DUF4158 domain-containing protein [Streptomyces flavidovirens]|uniref:DUF4158 domain-containing protein n=1 Tax=Streptomyces flavidovirens TaxID=67298 RepID=UPI0036B69B83